MLLKVDSISKSYSNPSGTKVRKVLDGVSFSMQKGDTASILGPSGSGKSTLLNIIGTLDTPDTGTVSFDDAPASQLRGSALHRFRNRQIGFVFQQHHLMPQCTLLENVLLPVLPVRDRIYRKEAEKRARDLINTVGLWEQRHQYPSTLSGGECQRAAVARALINRPRLVLADEPTGSLDRKNAGMISDLLMKLNEELKCALLVVTHASELARHMQSTYMLRDGKLSPHR